MRKVKRERLSLTMSVKKEAVGGEEAKKKSFISTRFLAAK
jgi:hypothetical protein